MYAGPSPLQEGGGRVGLVEPPFAGSGSSQLTIYKPVSCLLQASYKCSDHISRGSDAHGEHFDVVITLF